MNFYGGSGYPAGEKPAGFYPVGAAGQYTAGGFAQPAGASPTGFIAAGPASSQQQHYMTVSQAYPGGMVTTPSLYSTSMPLGYSVAPGALYQRTPGGVGAPYTTMPYTSSVPGTAGIMSTTSPASYQQSQYPTYIASQMGIPSNPGYPGATGAALYQSAYTSAQLAQLQQQRAAQSGPAIGTVGGISPVGYPNPVVGSNPSYPGAMPYPPYGPN